MDEITLENLTGKALELGADDALVTSTGVVVVEDDFRQLCEPPKCENYGLSANCPPHVMETNDFKELLNGYREVLFFRLDVPMEILVSDERDHVASLVQGIAAELERFAVELGFENARGLAGGCCKKAFCVEYERCNVLDGGECRNPDRARPSMSGLGVNFNQLNRSLEWPRIKGESQDQPDTLMGWLAGAVLLG